MRARRRRGRVDQTWARLLARLRLLAADYEEIACSDSPALAPVSPFAAMHASLTLLVTLAELFEQGRREGWSTLMTFAPPGGGVGRTARVSVSIVEGRR